MKKVLDPPPPAQMPGLLQEVHALIPDIFWDVRKGGRETVWVVGGNSNMCCHARSRLNIFRNGHSVGIGGPRHLTEGRVSAKILRMRVVASGREPESPASDKRK